MKHRRTPDFSGWATVYGKLCGDGRVIKPGAFSDMDGKEVPLVYQHNHDDVEQVIGTALLHSVPNRGMRCDGFFNDSAKADCARAAVDHQDITSLSIWANNLTENARHEVSHGTIREVSLVLSGANPDARIDYVSLAHGDYPSYEEAIIYNGVRFDYDEDLMHADEDSEEEEEDDEEDYEEEEEDEDDEDDEDYEEDEDDENEDLEDAQDYVYDLDDLIDTYGSLSDREQEIFNDALAAVGGEELTEQEFEAIVDMLSDLDEDTQDELLALLQAADDIVNG